MVAKVQGVERRGDEGADVANEGLGIVDEREDRAMVKSVGVEIAQ
jgi:hypothetical protein